MVQFLHGQEINLFSKVSRSILGPTTPHIQLVRILFPQGKMVGAWSWPPTTFNKRSSTAHILLTFLNNKIHQYPAISTPSLLTVPSHYDRIPDNYKYWNNNQSCLSVKETSNTCRHFLFLIRVQCIVSNNTFLVFCNDKCRASCQNNAGQNHNIKIADSMGHTANTEKWFLLHDKAWLHWALFVKAV